MIVRTIHVGVGGRGTWPVELLAADPHYQPVALVDINLDFLADAAKKLGLPDSVTFTSLKDAVEAVDADAVIICSPTRTHAEYSRIGFDAGKHVLTEKGMTMDWAEANDLVRHAEAAGVCFCVSQNYRYQANERTVRRLLADPDHPHAPGKVEIADYIHHRYRPEPRTLNYPYAMVWDMGCHHVDSLGSWLGAAVRVTAHSYNTTWSAYEHDADIEAFIEYESGAVCHYVLTHTATISSWQVTLQGEKGALRLYDRQGVAFYPKPTAQLGGTDPISVDLEPPSRSEQGVIDDFYRYIADSVEPGISGRNNLKTLAVCEMLVRSARERRPIDRAELDVS